MRGLPTDPVELEAGRPGTRRSSLTSESLEALRRGLRLHLPLALNLRVEDRRAIERRGDPVALGRYGLFALDAFAQLDRWQALRSSLLAEAEQLAQSPPELDGAVLARAHLVAGELVPRLFARLLSGDGPLEVDRRRAAQAEGGL